MWISSDYSTDENERELVYPARELRIEFRMSKTQNVFFWNVGWFHISHWFECCCISSHCDIILSVWLNFCDVRGPLKVHWHNSRISAKSGENCPRSFQNVEFSSAKRCRTLLKVSKMDSTLKIDPSRTLHRPFKHSIARLEGGRQKSSLIARKQPKPPPPAFQIDTITSSI